MRYAFCLSLSLFCAATARAGLIDSELILEFFDTYDTVWPDDANKLAYVFFSSATETSANKTLLLLDGKLVLDPAVAPDEDTTKLLKDWLRTTPFDASISYYRILKDFEEGTSEIPEEEVSRMRYTFMWPAKIGDLIGSSRHWRHLKKRTCPNHQCEANVQCLESEGSCLCTSSAHGRYCQNKQ